MKSMKIKRKKLYALILMVCLTLTCFTPAPVSAYSSPQSYSTYSRTAKRVKFNTIYYTKNKGYYYYKLVIPYRMNIRIAVADYTNAPYCLYAYNSSGRYLKTLINSKGWSKEDNNIYTIRKAFNIKKGTYYLKEVKSKKNRYSGIKITRY